MDEKSKKTPTKKRLKISKMKILEKHEIEKGVRNWRRNSDTS
jgi:hypothetical protein